MFILILFAHVGAMGSGNSNALTSVSGFKNENACVIAGKKAEQMAAEPVKRITFICAYDQ